MSRDPLNPVFEVRGHSAYNQKARRSVRTLGFAVDVICITGLIFLGWHKLSPSLYAWFKLGPFAIFAGLFILFLLTWVALQVVVGGTPGQLIWHLRRLVPHTDGPSRPPRSWREFLRESQVVQHEQLQLGNTLTAIFLTFIATVISSAIVWNSWSKEPFLAQAPVWELQPFQPEEIRAEGPSVTWGIAPFFYSIGVWPKTFDDRPILYSLPYEKGPPSHFVGHIVARWEQPDTQLVFEGPRTPGATRDEIRECFVNTWPLSCLRIREAVLSHAIKEIEQLRANPLNGSLEWTVRWFAVKNPAIPVEEQPQGIFLSASPAASLADFSGFYTEERYILVNPKGTLQTIALTRPAASRSNSISKILEQAVRSQRVSSELNTGRAWVDRLLTQTRLTEADMGRGTDPDPAVLVKKISELQLVLLSKLSVDPKTYETYYHLAGTASMLARLALKHKNSDWAAIAKPLVQNAYRYAQDVAPNDARTRQIQNMWFDVKGL